MSHSLFFIFKHLCDFFGHLLHAQDLEEELELDRRRVSEAEGVAKRAEEELAVAKERLLLQEDELQSRAGSHSGLKVISSTSGDVKNIAKQGGGSSSMRKVTVANQKPEEKVEKAHNRKWLNNNNSATQGGVVCEAEFFLNTTLEYSSLLCSAI